MRTKPHRVDFSVGDITMIYSLHKKSSRLLILTQKVDINDPILGFFHRWIEEFSKHCEQITVIALGVGEYHLPKNIRVFSLGKEHLRKRSDLGNSGLRSVLAEQLRKARYILSFYHLIWRERKNYDAVFVHMNPIYVVLGGLLWKILRKKIGLWYTHKNIDLKLRIAEKFTNVIFTASLESFRLMSNKIKIVGHGIDTEMFRQTEKEKNEILRMVTVGRISPVKDYETLINAVEILTRENISLHLDIVGGTATTDDKNYLAKLHNLVRDKKLKDSIRFVGEISHKDLPPYLQHTDIFVNMSNTGSLDKAVLEAMACGSLILTSNGAFRDIFGVDKQISMFPSGDAGTLAEKIKKFISLGQEEKDVLTKRFRNVIVEKHNIKSLIPCILSFYETSQ